LTLPRERTTENKIDRKLSSRSKRRKRRLARLKTRKPSENLRDAELWKNKNVFRRRKRQGYELNRRRSRKGLRRNN
jgi:hypothetical protein